jgi:hypothetical protein
MGMTLLGDRQMWFDPERNLKTEHWRGENGSYKIETYQWFTEDGKPSSFHHTLEEREPGKTQNHP